MGKKQIWQWVEYVILFSFLSIFYCNGLETISFKEDESQWIATSYVYEDYFHGDFYSPSWNESYWTVTQPPLARYLIGLGRKIGGLGVSDLNAPWDFQKDHQTNLVEGRMPSERLLWWSRLPMGILAACAILIGFYFLKRLQGRFPGYIWVLLCLMSSFFPEMLSRAMGEASLLACIAGILLISDCLLQGSDNRELLKKPDGLYAYFLLLGIAVGLAQSSKLNGLSAIGAAFAIAFILAFRMKRAGIKRIRFGLISLLIIIFSSQLTFLILNPYLWKNPLVRIRTMFANRVFEMHIQQIDYPDSKIEGLSEHISVVSNRIFQSYPAIHFDGAFWINVIFLMIGLIYLVVKAVQYLKRSDPNSAAVAMLLVGGATSFPSLMTPLDWDRYYLLPVYFSTFAIAVGIWRSGSFVFESIGKQVNFQRKI